MPRSGFPIPLSKDRSWPLRDRFQGKDDTNEPGHLVVPKKQGHAGGTKDTETLTTLSWNNLSNQMNKDTSGYNARNKTDTTIRPY